MKAIDYADQERFSLGVVGFVQKAKRCGKENCSQCPHKGYWYARIPSYFARDGAAREVYLGRGWTDADLREKVAPLLDEKRRVMFLALLDQQVTREEIAARLTEARKYAEQKRRLEAAFKRDFHQVELQQKNNMRAIEEAQKRLRALGKAAAGGR